MSTTLLNKIVANTTAIIKENESTKIETGNPTTGDIGFDAAPVESSSVPSGAKSNSGEAAYNSYVGPSPDSGNNGVNKQLKQDGNEGNQGAMNYKQNSHKDGAKVPSTSVADPKQEAIPGHVTPGGSKVIKESITIPMKKIIQENGGLTPGL